MLKLTDQAAEVVRELSGDGGLRLSGEEVNGSVELQLAKADEPTDGDDVVEQDGARVFLDEAASAVLNDQVLEVERHEDHVHFVFSPQQGG